VRLLQQICQERLCANAVKCVHTLLTVHSMTLSVRAISEGGTATGLPKKIKYGHPRSPRRLGNVAEPPEFGALWQAPHIEALSCVGIKDPSGGYWAASPSSLDRTGAGKATSSIAPMSISTETLVDDHGQSG
jgi:hypothetical protein